MKTKHTPKTDRLGAFELWMLAQNLERARKEGVESVSKNLRVGGYFRLAEALEEQVYLEKAQDRLIAAAPELLEALKNLVSTARTFRNVPVEEKQWTSIDDDALEWAITAIARATGE